jgi:hypothetical protein
VIEWLFSVSKNATGPKNIQDLRNGEMDKKEHTQRKAKMENIWLESCNFVWDVLWEVCEKTFHEKEQQDILQTMMASSGGSVSRKTGKIVWR